MKRYFAYIRVSTPKQGKGVSLEEQQAAIRAHAERRGLEIVEWLEEKETAAKTGRQVFSKMLARLEKGDAEGLIIHKIDRSARNLSDWAYLSKLFDRGIDVQFAHDSLDLKSRGGRLSADIMAIVAADYIRNLREEVLKGFYGRLKQGLYPLGAPIGYLDQGGGKLKAIDPERAALVRLAFERYATATVGLKPLCREMRQLGLRSRRGKVLSVNCIAKMLRNPFYIGLMRIRTTGEIFEGKHPPLIDRATFDRVQAIMDGKTVATVLKHEFSFRRLVRCETCGRALVGERQKGHVYYRCHSETCGGTSVREETLDDLVQKALKRLTGDAREIGEIRDLVEYHKRQASRELEKLREATCLLVAKCDDRLTRLTDALIDGIVDAETFDRRKQQLIFEKQAHQDRLNNLTVNDVPARRALTVLELSNVAYVGYKNGNAAERRKIIELVSSNFSVRAKKPAIALRSPYQEIVNWRESQECGLASVRPRTRARQLLDKVMVLDSRSNFTSVHDISESMQREVRKMGERLDTMSPTSPTSTRSSWPYSTRRPSKSRVGKERRAAARGNRRVA